MHTEPLGSSESSYLGKGGGAQNNVRLAAFSGASCLCGRWTTGAERADCTSDEGYPQPRRGAAVHLGLARPHPARCPLDPTHASACVGTT